MIFYYQFLLIVFTIGGAAHKAATKAMVCLHAREQGKNRGGERREERREGRSREGKGREEKKMGKKRREGKRE